MEYSVKKQKLSIFVFFLTEMWERYGFYVIQSLLALYLSFHFGLPDEKTYMLVGSFTALTYISPIFGGWLADKYIGQKLCVLAGAFVLFLSYILVAFSSSIHGLMLSLSWIAVGTGLLKPNISSLLGKQYKKGDPKRVSGFTIFYMGITLGIVLGTLLPSKIQSIFGWPACFITASAGAIFAFLVFLIGTLALKIKNYHEHKTSRPVQISITITTIIVVTAIYYIMLSNAEIAGAIFIIVVIISFSYVIFVAYSDRHDKAQSRKTVSFLLLCIVSILFWAFYFQMFLSLTLFITRAVQTHIFGIWFPAPYYVSLESFGMLVFGLIMIKIFGLIKTPNVAFRVSVKFTVSMFFIMLAYILIMISSHLHYNTAELIIPWFLICSYLIISIAELLLSPVGLSAVTSLSKHKTVSTMMGVFFVSLGAGGFLAGKLATITAIDHNIKNIVIIKHHYYHTFLILTIFSIAAFLLTLLITFIIKKITDIEEIKNPVL